jgi:hypothetical protein
MWAIIERPRVNLTHSENPCKKAGGILVLRKEMSAAEQWVVQLPTDRNKRVKVNEVIASEEGIAMASEVLITISKDEVERAWLMSEWKYEVDTQNKVVQAKREEWREAIKVTRNAKQLGIG